jgi:transcription elongation factor GreA
VTDQLTSTQNGAVTLGQAFQEYLDSLKPESRMRYGTYVRKYVEFAGHDLWIASLTESHVEHFRETQIQSTDPAAPDRVAALKDWFQFLKKRSYTHKNLGVYVRVKRSSSRTSSTSSGAHVRTTSSETIEMTAEGVEALREELEQLQAQHPEIVKAIQEAREDKDFRENSPLEAAREALAFNDQRRREIEAALKRAVIAGQSTADVSAVGSMVKVTRLDNDTSNTWKLVGPHEANAREQKISVESPVGKALIGRRPGDVVNVETPSGQLEFRIDEISQS